MSLQNWSLQGLYKIVNTRYKLTRPYRAVIQQQQHLTCMGEYRRGLAEEWYKKWYLR